MWSVVTAEREEREREGGGKRWMDGDRGDRKRDREGMSKRAWERESEKEREAKSESAPQRQL